MSELELSFLNYLFTDRPPIALLKSYKPELRIKDQRVINVVEYLCSLPEDHPVPDYLTATNLLHKDQVALDLLGEAVGIKRQAPDMEDYSLLLAHEDNEGRREKTIVKLKKAIASNDHERLALYSEEYALIARESRIRIGAVNPEDFLDMEELLKPEQFISTHIPRLNQHLGGWPNENDCEESGGFTRGEVAIIGASTNQGKTALATSLWYNFIAKSLGHPEYRSVYINYESAYTRFKKTLFAHITGVYLNGKTTKEQADRATQEYINFLTPRKENYLLYDGAGNCDMPDSTASLELEIAKQAERGFVIFIIDTINSVDNRDTSQSWEITERTMRMLERMIKRYNLCIIVTAQNKQGLEFEDQKWPDLKWIGQSSTLKQKPGTAIGIYRSDRYSNGAVDYTTLAIIKTRHRTPMDKEGVPVSYDFHRRMYIPYRGTLTDIQNSSETVKREQILAALREDIDVAFADI